MAEGFVLKGNICYSREDRTLECVEQGYLVCVDGRSEGAFHVLPERYEGFPLTDYGDRILIPGLVDLHLHGPQYSFRGLGMDLELLEWLNTHTFPEEARYSDREYARSAYSMFADDMKRSGTTRACIFGTLHREATVDLMDLMEATGLKTMVGKVNMDRNCPDNLVEESAEASIQETLRWLEEIKGRYKNTQPILTPRFIPTCTDELMEQLKGVQRSYHLPVQSHLSENVEEIAWVKELCPWSEFYGDVYDRFGLFGGEVKTIMAHCVWSKEAEVDRMRERGVYVAHCPQSNANLASGIAPVRLYLEKGLKVGLGTDVAGGSSLSVFRAMTEAVQMSKLRWRLQDERLSPLTPQEAFYLGTRGGGSFFGKVGSFEEDYQLDALVLNDSGLGYPRPLSLPERLERFICLADEGRLDAKYVAGVKIF